MKNKKGEKHLLLEDKRPGQFWSYDAVFDLPVTEHAKIVYFNLCRRANKHAQAHPSFALIAKDCSISRSSSLRAINLLLEFGLIRKHTQKEIGKNPINIYTLLNISEWIHKVSVTIQTGVGGTQDLSESGVSETPVISETSVCEIPVLPEVVSERHQGGVSVTPEGKHIKEYINNNTHHHQDSNSNSDDDDMFKISLPKDSYFQEHWLLGFLSKFRKGKERDRAKRLAEQFDYFMLNSGKRKEWVKNPTGIFVCLVRGEVNLRLSPYAPSFEERVGEEKEAERESAEMEEAATEDEEGLT